MITLSVPDMSCGHCKASVEAALSPIATAIVVDLDTRTVHAEAQDVGKLIHALAEIGFPASPAG